MLTQSLHFLSCIGVYSEEEQTVDVCIMLIISICVCHCCKCIDWCTGVSVPFSFWSLHILTLYCCSLLVICKLQSVMLLMSGVSEW